MSSRQKTIFSVLICLSVIAASAPLLILQLNKKRVPSFRLFTVRIPGFAYAPRLPQSLQQIAARERSSNVDFEKRRARGDDPRSRAIAALLMGDRSAAINDLERAVRTTPRDGELWSNLAAAYAVDSEASNDLHKAAMALAAADRALEIDPLLLDAQFNRALMIERLGLRTLAAQAWRAYLIRETDADWAAEARDHIAVTNAPTVVETWPKVLQELEVLSARDNRAAIAAVVSRFRLDARASGEAELLARWGEAELGHQTQTAIANLTLARAIGDALNSLSGEGLLRSVVDTIDKSAPSDRRVLAAAHVSYRRARLLYRDRKVTEADAVMRNAAAEFRSAHSPMAAVCDYYQSSILFDEHRSIEALSLIRKRLAEVSPSFIALRAQMEWNVGTIAANRGQLDEALRAYTASLNLFEHLGESENAASMRAALASTLAHFGRTQEAWTMRYQVFDAASRAGGDTTLPFVIQAAIGDEALEHHWDVVRSLASLQLLARGMNPRMRFAALLRYAWADHELGDASSFETHMRRANIVAASLSDPVLRATSADEADFVNAVEAVQRDPRSAIARLDLCERFAAANERSGNLPAIYLARGRAYRADGDIAHAIQDVGQSVSIVEKRRDAIRRDDLRDTYFGAGHAAYQELTDLLLKQGNAAAAFEMNERSRARLVLDRLNSDTRRAGMMSAVELTDHLRNKMNLIELISLPDRLAIFTISSSGFRSVETPLSRTALLEHIRALTAAIASDNERQAAAQLFGDLIAPANLPNDNLPIVIVPDDATIAIPYPVLWDTLHSQYLIERQPIVVAPNATSFVEIRRHLPTRRRSTRLFAAGDPAFDATLFPGLVRLPAAAEEVSAIAKLYDESECVTATDATAARLVAGLPRANVIHIAAHSIRNATDALLSGFVLATSARASALFTVRDIASLSLPLHPVVMLAGCQTGQRADGASDLQSLAAAFVVSGSSSVVGSLWNIDDDDAAEVSRAFHRQLRQGFSPSVALQVTQLAMLRSNDPALSRPRTWAAFETYGSGN